MPVRLESPCVPRRPTRLLCEAGLRIEPHVSLPMPAAAKFAAIAAPVPPLDPPGLRSRSYGLRVCPNRDPTVVMPGGELVHVGLGKNHRACLLKLADHERVARGME